ncbi:MAG: dihydroorotase [Methyloversatilis sp.]|uniref:dihydroorotase n=1 Tax=Methyloversatilis sp. TaxID=2569862 RepID=UPI0027353836|nr:dihydroorotase [Methyloversatilis sp.]MDP3873448.1 dihydroorotase [Methyloversatilis sp.]
MKIHIKGGHLIDPAQDIDAPTDLYIAAGKVVALGDAPDGFHANRVLDATGRIVAPGLIDLCARLREPGLEYRATLESEMAAAVAGGITSLACPPDTDPVLDEPGLVEMLKHRARMLNLAHVYPHGALTMGLKGQRLTEMGELFDAGCIAFSQANVPVADTQVLFRAMQYAATFGYTVWLQPTDLHLSSDGVAHEGEVAARLGLTGIPILAETLAIGQMLQLARATGCRLHLARISSRAGLMLIDQARLDGLKVSCDVAIHSLHLCDVDIGYFDPQCRTIPPLRAQFDREALRAALADGRIDALCSDHTPVDDDAKQVPFAEAEPGTTGLELLLPLTLSWAREMHLPLPLALARITSDAARVLGLDAGHLRIGSAADVCIFDPDAPVMISRATLRSQGRNTPFIGRELLGKVCATLVSGQVVYETPANDKTAR